jgi:AraC family transcriptional regulator
MCCGRCITAVQKVLEGIGVKYKNVMLGSAVISEKTDFKKLEIYLKRAGFVMIKSKEEEISEKVKIAVRSLFVETEKIELNNFSLNEYLELQIQLPYKRISEIFSQQENRTIEKYFILQRIEKIKSMIEETDLSFSEIAFKLGYNSLSHLSKQFKAIEGISMHSYRLMPKSKRKFIDKV